MVAELAGKTVVITGAADGIGRARITLFLEGGTNLVLIGRDGDAVERACRDVGCSGTQVTSLLDSPEACASAPERCRRVDAVVHFARVYEPDDVDAASRGVGIVL